MYVRPKEKPPGTAEADCDKQSPPEPIRQQIIAINGQLSFLEGQAVEPSPDTPQPETQLTARQQEQTPVPVTNPKAKSAEQREAIIQEILHRGWNPQAIPSGGVEELKNWFMQGFNRSNGVFRERWQELRRENKVDTDSDTGKNLAKIIL